MEGCTPLSFSPNGTSVRRATGKGREGCKIIGNLSSESQKPGPGVFFSRQQKVLCNKNVSKA